MRKSQAWIRLIFLFSTLVTSICRAETSEELKTRALSEIRQQGKAGTKSSDAQVSGAMLSLKDPMPEIRGRSWDYFLRLSVQSFQPRGSAGNDLTDTRFPLDGGGATVMPSVALGFRAPLALRFSWGVGAKLGYATQHLPARFDTGFVESDAHLNSTLLAATPFLTWQVIGLNWLSVNAGAEFGNVTYTQTSSNKLASFTEHSAFTGWSGGLEFALTSNFHIQADLVRRKLATADTRLGLQQDNFEVGTRILW